MELQKLKHEIAESWLLVKIFFYQKIDGLRLTFAIWMADALQAARNKQFYVMDNGNGRLIWLCNDDIKIMRKPRLVQRLVYDEKTQKHVLKKFKVSLMPKNTTHTEVMRDCYYYTAPNRQNKNGITVEERNSKRKAWIEYMEKYRMNRMLGKRKVKTRK